jgi:hypothetical protein
VGPACRSGGGAEVSRDPLRLVAGNEYDYKKVALLMQDPAAGAAARRLRRRRISPRGLCPQRRMKESSSSSMGSG